ncbi:hypothetical protein [Catellatospora tritici]|uniref:hypothetical protein n=1 Tax=Catellatospora tritici TaxID=2851566 RepID=UPI001C2D77E6|nr:hypothetical protein [Catellatospora tritici]MBV1856608.1 hypothetical protein [Catellatospora tritici]
MSGRRLNTRPWSPENRTGGPVDDLLDGVRARFPRLVVERLVLAHAGDDDNVYFLGDAEHFDRVQVDTHPGGNAPFLVEGGNSALVEGGNSALVEGGNSALVEGGNSALVEGGRSGWIGEVGPAIDFVCTQIERSYPAAG